MKLTRRTALCLAVKSLWASVRLPFAVYKLANGADMQPGDSLRVPYNIYVDSYDGKWWLCHQKAK